MRALVALVAAFPLAAFAQWDPTSEAAAPPPAAYAPAPASAPAPRGYRQYAPKAKQRDGWYIGFGLGSGDASVTMAGETHAASWYGYADPTTVSLNFTVGATISPKLLLGFDAGLNSTQAESGGDSSLVQMNYYDVGLTYFPNERGFFVRGAAGLASLSWKLDPYFDDTYRGFNVLGGVGYAWWLGDSFNLTFNVEGSKQWYSDDVVESAQFWNAYVGFSWY
jgi:hypothetical protein